MGIFTHTHLFQISCSNQSMITESALIVGVADQDVVGNEKRTLFHVICRFTMG